MKTVPYLFARISPDQQWVKNQVTPGCEWVLAGEGVATTKWDGEACMVRDGKLYKSYIYRLGAVMPPGFEPVEESIGGRQAGWVPIVFDKNDPNYRLDDEPFIRAFSPGMPDATYELVGPDVHGNRHELRTLQMIRHADFTLPDAPRTFEGLKEYLRINPFMEGIVFHHPDGRMAKVKQRDFAFFWPPRIAE